MAFRHLSLALTTPRSDIIQMGQLSITTRGSTCIWKMVQSNFDPNETNTKSDGETMFEGPWQGENSECPLQRAATPSLITSAPRAQCVWGRVLYLVVMCTGERFVCLHRNKDVHKFHDKLINILCARWVQRSQRNGMTSATRERPRPHTLMWESITFYQRM